MLDRRFLFFLFISCACFSFVFVFLLLLLEHVLPVRWAPTAFGSSCVSSACMSWHDIDCIPDCRPRARTRVTRKRAPHAHGRACGRMQAPSLRYHKAAVGSKHLGITTRAVPSTLHRGAITQVFEGSINPWMQSAIAICMFKSLARLRPGSAFLPIAYSVRKVWSYLGAGYLPSRDGVCYN